MAGISAQRSTTAPQVSGSGEAGRGRLTRTERVVEQPDHVGPVRVHDVEILEAELLALEPSPSTHRLTPEQEEERARMEISQALLDRKHPENT